MAFSCKKQIVDRFFSSLFDDEIVRVELSSSFVFPGRIFAETIDFSADSFGERIEKLPMKKTFVLLVFFSFLRLIE